VQGTFPTIREAMRQRGWIEKETNRNKATMSLDDGEKFFHYNKERMV
jgi:hypothetical protein